MGCASSTPFLSAHGGPVKNMDPRGDDGSETDVKDGQVKESLIGAVTNIGHSIGDVVKNGTHDIKEMVTTSIEKVPDEIKAHVNKLLNDDKAVIENSLDDLNQTIDSETNTIKENAAELSKAFDDEIESAVNDTEKKIIDVKENISDALENVKDDLLDVNSVDSMDSLKTTIPEPEIEKALKNSSDDEMHSPTPKPTYSELEILQNESDAILKNNSTPTNENLANQHKCLSKKLDELAMHFENFITQFQKEETKNELKNIATSTTSSLEANDIKNENISKITEDSAAEKDIIYHEQRQEEDIKEAFTKDGDHEDYKEPHSEQENMLQEPYQESEIKTNFETDNINVNNMESTTDTECKIVEESRDDSRQGKVLENLVLVENKELESATIDSGDKTELTAETSDALLKIEKTNVMDLNGTELITEQFKIEKNQNIEKIAFSQTSNEENKVSENSNENIAESENKKLEPAAVGLEDIIKSTPETYNETKELIKDEQPTVIELNSVESNAEKLEVEENQNNNLAQEENADINNVSTNYNKDLCKEINESKIETYYSNLKRPLRKYARSLPENNEICSIITKTDGVEVSKQNDKKFEKIIKNIKTLGMLNVKKQDNVEYESNVQDKTEDEDVESPNKNIEKPEIQSFAKQLDIEIETEMNTTNIMEHKINDQAAVTTRQDIEINLECPTPSVSENSEKTEVIKKLIPRNLLENLTKIFGLKANHENEINSTVKPDVVTTNMKELHEENLNLESTENQTNQLQFQDEKLDPLNGNGNSNQEEENQLLKSLGKSDENPITLESPAISKTEDASGKFVIEMDVEDPQSSLTNNTAGTDKPNLGIENTNIQIHDENNLDTIDVVEVTETEPEKKRKKIHKRIKSLKTSQTIIENDGKTILEEKFAENSEINETSVFSENMSRTPSPIFPLAHRRAEFRKLGWSFLLANLDTLREIRDNSGIFGNEILATLNILNYFVVEYDKKHRTFFDRIDTKLEKLRDFLREKFTHFYFYQKFKQLFKKEEPQLIPRKIIYESETEEETEEMEEIEPEEVEPEESEEEETDDELPILDLTKTAEELLNDIEFLVNKDPNDEEINSTEDEVGNLSENEISETELDNKEFDIVQEKQIKNYELKDDKFKEDDNLGKIPQLTTKNSVESNKSYKIEEITENIQAQDIDTQISDRQEYSLLNEEVEKPKDIKNEDEKQNDTEKLPIKKTPNFLKVAPFKLKKKKGKKKFVNRIPVDPTHWEEIADELAKKSLKNYKKLSRNYSSESVWSGDAGSWKKPNSLYLVFGNNFLRTPKIKIIESGHTNQWTQRPKKDRTELDVYTGKLMTDNDVFQESREDKSHKWKSFELEMKASQLEINKKIYNLTDTEDYPINKSRTEITLDWLKNDIKRFKEEYGAFNRRDFDYFGEDSDFDHENYTPWTGRSNRLPYLRNINQKNRYHNLNLNPYRNNYYQTVGSQRFANSHSKHSNNISRFPPNRNLHHKYDKNIFTKNQNTSKKFPDDDAYYSSSNSAKSFDIGKQERKVKEKKSEKYVKERKHLTNSEVADSDSNSGKSLKKDAKNQKNKKIKSNSNENSDEHVNGKESKNKETGTKSDEEKKVKNESNMTSDVKLNKSDNSDDLKNGLDEDLNDDSKNGLNVDLNDDLKNDLTDDLKNKDYSDNDINLKESEEEKNEEPNNESNLSKQSSKNSRTSSINSKINKIPNDAKNKTDDHFKYNDFNNHKKHSRKPEKNVIQNNLNSRKTNKSKNPFKDQTEDLQQTRGSDTDQSQSIVEDKRKHKTKAWLENQGKNSKHIDSSEIDSNGDPIEKTNFKLPYIKSQYFNQQIGNKNFQDQSFSEDSDINGKYNIYEKQNLTNRKFKESFDFMHKDFTSDSDSDRYHQRSKFMDDSQKYYNYYDYE